jgi:hypothetical protein
VGAGLLAKASVLIPPIPDPVTICLISVMLAVRHERRSQ